MMRPANKWFGIFFLTMVMMISACTGGKDFSYWSDNEVPRGKGLLSGDDGYFTIYRKEGKPAGQQAETKDAAETGNDNKVPASE